MDSPVNQRFTQAGVVISYHVKVALNALPPFNLHRAAESGDLQLNSKGRLCGNHSGFADEESANQLIEHCEASLRFRYPNISFSVAKSTNTGSYSALEKLCKELTENKTELEILTSKPRRVNKQKSRYKPKSFYITSKRGMNVMSRCFRQRVSDVMNSSDSDAGKLQALGHLLTEAMNNRDEYLEEIEIIEAFQKALRAKLS